jgi:hypothetical protein
MMKIHPKVAKNRNDRPFERKTKPSSKKIPKDNHFLGARSRSSFGTRGSTLSILNETGSNELSNKCFRNFATTEDKGGRCFISRGCHGSEERNYTRGKANKQLNYKKRCKNKDIQRHLHIEENEGSEEVFTKTDEIHSSREGKGKAERFLPC